MDVLILDEAGLFKCGDLFDVKSLLLLRFMTDYSIRTPIHNSSQTSIQLASDIGEIVGEADRKHELSATSKPVNEIGKVK